MAFTFKNLFRKQKDPTPIKTETTDLKKLKENLQYNKEVIS